jgi:hypothetical protein
MNRGASFASGLLATLRAGNAKEGACVIAVQRVDHLALERPRRARLELFDGWHRLDVDLWFERPQVF